MESRRGLCLVIRGRAVLGEETAALYDNQPGRSGSECVCLGTVCELCRTAATWDRRKSVVRYTSPVLAAPTVAAGNAAGIQLAKEGVPFGFRIEGLAPSVGEF